MSYIFGSDTGQTQESITDARRRLAFAMLQQGQQATPIQSAWQGAARLAQAVMGGLELRKLQGDQQSADAQGFTDVTGQPYAPPQSPGFLSSLFGSNKVPASGTQGQVATGNPSPAGGGIPAAVSPHDTSGLTHNDVYNGFIDTVKQGGVTNPYGLAAIASTGTAESGFSPKNVNAAWADPSASGQAGTAGGLMSWRNERLANLRNYAQANGENPANISPQMQAKFFLQEDPTLIQKLNGAQSVQEAQQLMNNAWAFKGYQSPGGESARRLATAQSLLPQFAGQQAAGPGPQVASLDPSTGMAQPTPFNPATASPTAMMQQLGIGGSGNGQPGYVDPRVTTAYRQPVPASPAVQAIQQQSPLPGPGGGIPAPGVGNDPTRTASIGPMSLPAMTGQAAPGTDSSAPNSPATSGYRPPVSIPPAAQGVPQSADTVSGSQQIASIAPIQQSSPQGASPNVDARGRLATALQSAPQAPQQSDAQVKLVQAMQGTQQAQGQPQGNLFANNPRAVELMRAMMNPNMSPQVRAMVGSALQQTMMPQLDFIPRADGSVVAVNKLTGQLVGTPLGALKTKQVIDGPVDPNTGLATKMIYDPVTSTVDGIIGPHGELLPPGGAGQQQAQGAAPGAIPQPPPGVDTKKYREEAGNISAHDLLPTAHDEMDFASNLTSRKNYQEFSAAAPTWNSFTQHIQDNSPASDKAIVDDFAKILNPGRAVTTGGFVLNMDAQGFTPMLKGQIEKAWNGDGELGPDARAQMARIAQIKMQEYQNAWGLDAAQGATIAKAHHMDPDRVIPKMPDLAPIDFSKINSVKTTTAGTAPYPGGASAPAKPMTDSDFNALPSGSLYIDPDDGKPYRKP